MLQFCKCRLECYKIMGEDMTLCKHIHSEYWKMAYNARKQWIFSHVNKIESTSVKRAHLHYFLPNGSGNVIRVCQKMFLSVLGYTSNKVIVSMMQTSDISAEMIPPSDKRGKHAPAHKIPNNVITAIRDHINSYNPSISHYRRQHAPNRLYLTSELTIKEMHKNFHRRGM